jgi:arabinofuranan 3-O-arabinosyltransferase
VTAPSPRSSTQSLQLFAVCAALTALALKQAPSRLVGDTKLDLAVDPVRLMSRALHLWDPSRDFGLTQNQNYGYLFPTGPFFALGKAVALPAWAVQRLWWAVLLCLAFLGLVKLAEALGIGTATSRLLAGVAFALSPRMLSTVGPISVESLPYCLAPWVLLPLVRGSVSGSPRRAAAQSAVAVLCMGAVNAIAVVAALPPAVLWLLTREAGPRRRALMGWWAGCVALATAWWVVPLLLLGKYSPPFLDYIETATTTTAVTSLVEVLRGTSDWIAYLSGRGGPTWPAGYDLLTNRLVITYTLLVLLAGLAGLLRRDLPERLWLSACLLLGVAAVTAGHLGDVHGVLASFEHRQLDGALAPLRNVHKFDVVLRLPIVLGLAHLVGRLMTSSAAPDAARRQRLVVTVAAAAVVLGAAVPALGVGLAPRHPFTGLPGYWHNTADWLADHESDGRALLVPGSSFPDYLWGNSNDEPLQPLARSPWAVRSAIPLTPAGTIRMLDAIEQRLARGEPSPGLADDLRRAGVAYVVVRNDLAYARAGSTRPLLVHEALAGSSQDISPVVSFGPKVGGARGILVDEGLERSYPAVEVLSVGRAPKVELTPLRDVVTVVGGAEAVADLADQGVLGQHPAVLSQQAVPELARNPVLVTDTLRRREVAFGQLNDNRSQTLTLTDPLRVDAHAHDYLAAGDAARLTVARLIGARALSASSSASDADAFGGAHPEHSPYAAVDGDLSTSWRSDPGQGLAGATWRVDFEGARTLEGSAVHLGASTQRPASIRVTTSAGSTTERVAADGTVAVAAGDTTFLQLTAIARPRADVGSFDVAEVTGLGIRRTLDVPASSRADVISLTAAVGRRSCYPVAGLQLCSSSVGRGSEEPGGLDRTLHVKQAARYAITATARPVPGPALDRLLDRGTGVTVTASSSAVQDPAGRPGAAYDGDSGTGWRAAPGDRTPTLTFSWPTARTISGVRLTAGLGLAASLPGKVTVTANGGSQSRALDRSGLLRLSGSIRTNRVSLQLQVGKLGGSIDPFADVRRLLPIGVSEVSFAGAAPPATSIPDIPMGCGSGPTIRVGRELRRTSLAPTREQLVALSPIALAVCDTADVEVANGTEIIAPATATFAPSTITLTAHPLPKAGATLPTTTPRWSADRRQVRLPDRPETTLLQVHENTNAGWIATLDGHRLHPVVVDGWQQGWVVPTGAAGVVHLDFTPDRLYRRALVAGLALVLVVLGLALLPARSTLPAVLPRRTAIWHVALLAGVLALIGGPVALALCLVAAVTELLPARVRTTAMLLAVGAAGALLVLHPWGRSGYLGRSTATQALCLIGLAGIWSALLRGEGMTTGRLRQVISGRSTKR